MKKSRDLQPMARSGVGTVEFCRDCQVLHVNLGAISIRFTPTGFRELCCTLAIAVNRLAVEAETGHQPEESECKAKEGLH